MSQWTVSCIIPVYNGEKHLAEAIDSLIAQTHEPIEIVVVDDGSTDGTAAILQRYGDRLNCLHQDNAGVSVARNQGVAASTGKLVGFLDADDRLHPEKIALQVAAFEHDPDLDFCDCNSAFFWSEELPPEQIHRDPRHTQDFWHKQVNGHISTWLLKRTLFDRVGRFKANMHYGEDIDWHIRSRDTGAACHTVDEVLTYRRLHPNNVTAFNPHEQMDGLTAVMKAHLDRIRAKS